MASLLETVQVLTSFDPPRRSLKDAPWERLSEWAVENGLASLIAYNLEYRLGGAGAPDEVRERLLSIHQGTGNDNVLKLVNFKRSLASLEGRQLVMLGGASYAEALYPHVAFRPVMEIDLLLRDSDVAGFTGWMARANFRPVTRDDVLGEGDAFLSDGRTNVCVHTSLFGGPTGPEELELLQRAERMKVYGESTYRLGLEDALLQTCVAQARAGYQVPMLTFVDLRELLTGATFMAGVYSRPPDLQAVKARAKAWGMERALYASVGVVEKLYPEAAAAVAQVRPELRTSTRALLDKAVVAPLLRLETRSLRGVERLRRWLTARARD
ncbi:MAG: nucleotidyltransferase family protein [Deltaproteobacteria bacterium]|nr:nucleotidyltransferase family protein [Deltaproteobacteria bacterium]